MRFSVKSGVFFVLFCFVNFITLTTAVNAAKPKLAPEDVYLGIGEDVLPKLSSLGDYNVGVRTVDTVNPKQLDVLSQKLVDRPLTLEVWYPALVTGNDNRAVYDDVTRTHKPFSIQGSAYRNAGAIKDKKFPLVILSHGYTGYRSLMFYLGEHLASHGYIVASIDHTDSRNIDIDMKNAPFSGFLSTLYNRSRDQYFVLNYFSDAANVLSTSVNTESSGIIGYSMGGYGAINSIGGCFDFSFATIARLTGAKDKALQEKMRQLLNSCAGGQYQNAKVDGRLKAAILIAPWGGELSVFSKSALSKVNVPALFISGDQDNIAGHESIKSIFEGLGSDSRYLLTYNNARHNIAGHPAPRVARTKELDLGHYWESSWNIEQLNAVNKHFALAMMNCHVKKLSSSCDFLTLPENSTQKKVNGKLLPTWNGFPDRFSTGMQWFSNK